MPGGTSASAAIAVPATRPSTASTPPTSSDLAEDGEWWGGGDNDGSGGENGAWRAPGPSVWAQWRKQSPCGYAATGSGLLISDVI